MNKLFYFFMICLYLLGTIGGIGNAVYNKAYVKTSKYSNYVKHTRGKR